MKALGAEWAGRPSKQVLSPSDGTDLVPGALLGWAG